MKQKRSLIGAIGLLTVWAILFALVYSVQQYFGESTVQSLDIAITGGLSFALVILYFRQTQILDSQRELLTQELNHEARQQHTETLKDRIRLWHGNPDREPPEDPLDSTGRNLPYISGTSIESAPSNRISFGADDSFEVVPYQLQNDRYLRDFLENHASDVRETAQEIIDLEGQYTSLMESFSLEEIEPPSYDEEEYRLEPTPWFEEWIFRQVILAQTGRYENLDEIIDRLPDTLDDVPGHGNADGWKTHIPVRKNETPVYQSFSKTESWDGMQDNRGEIETQVLEAVEQTLRELRNDPAYSIAIEGAQIFESAAESIEELEQLLIEYEGKPIIQGDCEYLEEARIG